LNWKCCEKRGEEREIAEGGITEIKGRLKIILRLNLTIQMMIKRNITDFGIISYECSSAENLIDGGDGVTIPPVVARIFWATEVRL